MVEIAKCRMCGNQGEPTGLDFSGGHYVKCSGTRCCYGPSRATKAEAIAAWNELMQPGEQPTPEMQSKTVRVRIPVWVANSGDVMGDFRAGKSGFEDWHDNSIGERFRRIVVAFDLPKFTDIHGTVEVSDD